MGIEKNQKKTTKPTNQQKREPKEKKHVKDDVSNMLREHKRGPKLGTDHGARVLRNEPSNANDNLMQQHGFYKK
jgi:hypothetical protein